MEDRLEARGPRVGPRPRRSGRRTGVFGLLAALTMALTMVPSAPVGAADGNEATYRPFQFTFDATTPRVDPVGCDVEFGAEIDYGQPTEHQCQGGYAQAGTAPFDQGKSGTLETTRNMFELFFDVKFYVARGSLSGRAAGGGSDAFTVTSANVNWGSDVHTPDLPGVASGAQGGPLKITVTNNCPTPGVATCKATIVLAGFVLASPPVPVPAPLGQEYAEFNMYLDARGLFLIEGCLPALWDLTNLGEYTCEGEYQPNRGTTQTTWPFDHGHGTMISEHTATEQVLTFYVSGARLGGRLTDNQTQLSIDDAEVPWGTNVHSPEIPSAAPGEKGGNLAADINRTRYDVSGSKGYTFNIHGWLLRNVQAPLGTPPPSAASPAAATAVAVLPRFTG